MATTTNSGGSSWLDDIFGDKTFLGTGFDKLSSFGERLTAILLNSKDDATPPKQTPTPRQNLSGENGTPSSTLILYAGSAVVLGLAVYFVFKK